MYNRYHLVVPMRSVKVSQSIDWQTFSLVKLSWSYKAGQSICMSELPGAQCDNAGLRVASLGCR